MLYQGFPGYRKRRSAHTTLMVDVWCASTCGHAEVGSSSFGLDRPWPRLRLLPARVVAGAQSGGGISRQADGKAGKEAELRSLPVVHLHPTRFLENRVPLTESGAGCNLSQCCQG